MPDIVEVFDSIQKKLTKKLTKEEQLFGDPEQVIIHEATQFLSRGVPGHPEIITLILPDKNDQGLNR